MIITVTNASTGTADTQAADVVGFPSKHLYNHILKKRTTELNTIQLGNIQSKICMIAAENSSLRGYQKEFVTLRIESLVKAKILVRIIAG